MNDINECELVTGQASISYATKLDIDNVSKECTSNPKHICTLHKFDQI